MFIAAAQGKKTSKMGNFNSILPCSPQGCIPPKCAKFTYQLMKMKKKKDGIFHSTEKNGLKIVL